MYGTGVMAVCGAICQQATVNAISVSHSVLQRKLALFAAAAAADVSVHVVAAGHSLQAGVCILINVPLIKHYCYLSLSSL